MEMLVYLLGLGHIVICSCLTLQPKGTIDVLRKLFQKFQLSYLAIIPALYGLLFWISASATIHSWVFWLVGILAFCEAILAFFNPNKIYSRLLDWYFDSVSDQTQRLLGIIGIIFGTLMTTWTK
jgi:hypothetical protein